MPPLTLDVANPAGVPALSLSGTLSATWNEIAGAPRPGTIDLQQGDFEIDGGTLIAATCCSTAARPASAPPPPSAPRR